MGAHSIEMTFNKRLTERQINQEFKRQQKADRAYNGHREGYSGDFQTVEIVKLHDKVFDNIHDAQDYCLDNAEKWYSVVAVYYLKNEAIKSKKLDSINAKANELKKKLMELEDKKLEEIKRIRTKAKKVKKNLGTIIAGWGAC